MTPEERHALADRLEAQASVDHGYHYCNATRADVRAAAAALREDADEHTVRLWQGYVDERTAERDAALAEVARLREGIERHRGACYDANSNDERLHALLDEGAPADAVVIPRSAIPDGLVERLDEAADYRERTIGARSPHAADLRAAARLLSGATEGDER